jgi:hypothetical protein
MINKINSEVNKKLQSIHSSYNGVTGSNYNAIFKFSVFSGEIVVDDFGNYTPETAQIKEIKAQVHSTKPDSSIQDNGLDYTRDYYKVWFLSPLNYKGEIPQVLDCKILINGFWLEGQFNVVRNNISNQLENSGIRKSLGYAIEGTFSQQTTQRA